MGQNKGKLSTFGIIKFIFPASNQVPIELLGYRKRRKAYKKAIDNTNWQLNGHTFKLSQYFCFI
jgi:hypothetical protein